MTYSIITENLQAVHFSSLFIVLWQYYLLKDRSPLIVCCAAFIYIIVSSCSPSFTWGVLKQHQMTCRAGGFSSSVYKTRDSEGATITVTWISSLCWWWWCKLVLVTEQRVFLWTTKRRFRFKSFLGCLSRKLLTFWWCMIKRKEGDDATLPNTESIHTFMYIRWSLLLVLCQLSQVRSSRLVKRFLWKPFLILINKSIFFELRKRDKQVKCLDMGAALWAQA